MYHVLITNENLTFLIERDQFFEITTFLELIFPKLQIKNFLNQNIFYLNINCNYKSL